MISKKLVFFTRLRMSSNRLKIIRSRFYRIACCLIEELRILLNLKMTRFLMDRAVVENLNNVICVLSNDVGCDKGFF